ITLVDGPNLGAGFTTVGATPSGLPNPTCAGTTSFNNDVWFTYTATCGGVVTFSMCGAPTPVFDSLLAVYTGSCGIGSIACDDDGCPTPPAFADVSIAATPVVAAGTTLMVRVGGFAATDTGAFEITVSCFVPTTDFGDASGATLAAHTSATVSEHLGTSVTGDFGTVTPSWYGDVGDDGIVSVSNLFPTSATAQIVVYAENTAVPTGFLDFCRIWVDRNTGVGWSTAVDGLPTQSANVGSPGTNFTFGPFTMSATSPPSPFVRVRLSFDTTGVSSTVGTGSFGEVEDYCLPGTGGPVRTSTAGQDAGDAPTPYPPCDSVNLNSERLGYVVTDDATAPVGPSAGNAAFEDDAGDDGIMKVSGLTPGGSCTLTIRGSTPAGTFTDTLAAWMDFDGDGNWDEFGEVFPAGSITVNAAGGTATLGPIPVPASAVNPVPTRVKLSFGTGAAICAGSAFTFGEIEDYRIPHQTGSCSGCNTLGGAAGSLAAVRPAELGGTLRLATYGAASTSVLTVMGRFSGPGADLFDLGAPIPPGTCFICVLPQLIFGGGVTDANGYLT
ncbi:MAG: GEVED domain-containing protein, partial [Planctomycetota bacterium]